MLRITTFAQNLVRRFRLNVHPWPSDRHLALDYPVAKLPRYGGRQAVHPAIKRLLDEQRPRFAETLDEIAARKPLLEQIQAESGGGALDPFWNNNFFPPLDACVLMHFLIKHNPRQLIEIGSGNSTIFARHAITAEKLRTRITSIDPEPRRGIDALCDKVIRSRLEDLDPAQFPKLEKGDILFFDGSHRVFTDSDVTVFFLEILPQVPPGVLVHVHDIFWPGDYPAEWGDRYYSEQYMLAMLMLYAPGRFSVLFSSVYASLDPALRAKVAALTPGEPLFGVYGTSFWFETQTDADVA